MEDKNYVNIQGWMRTELGLKSNELIVYAIIFGFSQDGDSKFYGSRSYIADWCGISIRQVQTILNSLVDRKLITKYEENNNGVKLCRYVANFTTSEKTSLGSEEISLGSEKTSLNNIDNTIDNNISNTNVLDTEYKPKKKNLYEKCVDEIYSMSDNEDLNNALLDYLSLRLSMTDKRIYGVGQWKGLLKKLHNMSGDKVAIVRQSIERGWGTFVEIKEQTTHKFNSSKYTGDNVFGENNVDCHHRAKGEESGEWF